MNISSICGAPFQTFADVIGRRGLNWIGNFIVVVAAILQGCAQNMPMFMAGRFFLGFGSAMMSSPQYMAEISPAHLRGRLVGIFGSFFQAGSILTLAAMVGFTDLSDSNNWQCRVPLLLEAIFPLIVCVFIFPLTPESPRYLVMKGKISKAREVIAKYHTTSEDQDAPLVDAVIRQIEDSIESDRVLNRQWWNWSIFLTKAARYRFLILVLYAAFQQWNGGGIITYYISPMLDQIGITSARDQLGWNLGLTCIYWLFTLVGATFIDKFRRRTLIFTSLIIFAVLQTAATLTSWQYKYVT
jgi:MFS family permease